ncbi:NADP-dependent oxidoreductase [Devosia sp. A16]|uniref:NADP-dependent oxidoreductase n=1 Tax=Devosia sp. A16 TaxID=1736675 RepID=UPI003FA488EB
MPVPSPGPGEVLVGVRAAAIQPFDRRVRSGTMPLSPDVALPLTTDNELAGVVAAIGPDVADFAMEERVAGRRAFGAAAEFAVLPATDLAKIPPALSFAQAATLSGTAQTADTAVESLAIGADDTLLIHGAAGGVGSFAAQLALARGAVVIGTASSQNQDYLRGLGVVPLIYGEGLAQRIAAAAPLITAILDCAGGEALDLSMSLGVPHQRIASLGDIARARQLGLKSVEGVRDGKRLARLLALAAAGKLHAEVRRVYPLEHIVLAHRELDTGHGRGKIVIAIE